MAWLSSTHIFLSVVRDRWRLRGHLARHIAVWAPFKFWLSLALYWLGSAAVCRAIGVSYYSTPSKNDRSATAVDVLSQFFLVMCGATLLPATAVLVLLESKTSSPPSAWRWLVGPPRVGIAMGVAAAVCLALIFPISLIPAASRGARAFIGGGSLLFGAAAVSTAAAMLAVGRFRRQRSDGAPAVPLSEAERRRRGNAAWLLCVGSALVLVGCIVWAIIYRACVAYADAAASLPSGCPPSGEGPPGHSLIAVGCVLYAAITAVVGAPQREGEPGQDEAAFAAVGGEVGGDGSAEPEPRGPAGGDVA